jgi:hypothetical protein
VERGFVHGILCANWYVHQVPFSCVANLAGVGAICYVEYARRLLPDPGQSDTEINRLTAAMIPGELPTYP